MGPWQFVEWIPPPQHFNRRQLTDCQFIAGTNWSPMITGSWDNLPNAILLIGQFCREDVHTKYLIVRVHIWVCILFMIYEEAIYFTVAFIIKIVFELLF